MILVFFIAVAFPQEENEFYNFSLLDQKAYAECIEGYLSDEIYSYFDGKLTKLM